MFSHQLQFIFSVSQSSLSGWWILGCNRLQKTVCCSKTNKKYMHKNIRTNILYFLLPFMLLFGMVGFADAAEKFEAEANSLINKAQDLIADLNGLISDAILKDIFVSYAEDARDDAVDSYFLAKKQKEDEDWEDVIPHAKEAVLLLEDAIEDLEDEMSLDAKAAIVEAEEMLDLAKEVLDDTDSDDHRYEDADRLFDQAKKVLEDAKNMLNDRDYDNGEENAEDSLRLAEDVFKELDVDIDDYLSTTKEERKETKGAIDDVADLLIDLADLIEEADDEDVETEEAEDSLGQAKKMYKSAVRLKVNRDWVAALEMASETKEFLNDIIDGLEAAIESAVVESQAKKIANENAQSNNSPEIALQAELKAKIEQLTQLISLLQQLLVLQQRS